MPRFKYHSCGKPNCGPDSDPLNYAERVKEAVDLLPIRLTQPPAGVRFHDWDWLVYCRILGHYWNQPVEELYGGNLGRASSLTGEDGDFLQLDPNAYYSFLVPDKWKEAQERGTTVRSAHEL
jgi:hypothetical protein